MTRRTIVSRSPPPEGDAEDDGSQAGGDGGGGGGGGGAEARAGNGGDAGTRRGPATGAATHPPFAGQQKDAPLLNNTWTTPRGLERIQSSKTLELPPPSSFKPALLPTHSAVPPRGSGGSAGTASKGSSDTNGDGAEDDDGDGYDGTKSDDDDEVQIQFGFGEEAPILTMSMLESPS